MEAFPDLLRASERRLAHRAISRARERGYGTYAPPLEEAWLAGVRGLTAALAATWARSPRPAPVGAREGAVPEAAAFAAEEARRHRERGLTLPMFLGLLKTFREAFLEAAEAAPEAAARELTLCFFDGLEVAVAEAWTSPGAGERERELAQANRRVTIEKGKLETLFASLPHPVLLVEPDGFLSGLNHAAERLFLGDAAPGASRLGGGAGRAPPWLLRRIGPVLAGATPQVAFEEELPGEGGRRRFAVSAERMLDVTHKFDGVAVWLEDVTDRRRMEARLHAAERLASLGTLAAGVAHEVASPLASVVSGLSHLARGLDEAAPALPAEQAADLVETAADAHDAAARVTRIVRAMQALSRQGAEELEPVLVAPALRRASAAVAPRLHGKARLVLHLEDLPPVWGRDEFLEQVFAELLGRAARALEGGDAARDAVRVEARAEGDEVHVEIVDSGPAPPVEQLRRALDPLAAARAPAGGEGIGAALAQAVVGAFGGTLAVEPAPGGGTLARVVLRAALGGAGAADGQEPPAQRLAAAAR